MNKTAYVLSGPKPYPGSSIAIVAILICQVSRDQLARSLVFRAAVAGDRDRIPAIGFRPDGG